MTWIFVFAACTRSEPTAPPTDSDTDVDTDTATPRDTEHTGDGEVPTGLEGCSRWVGFAPGRTWTYETVGGDGTFQWTQTLTVDSQGPVLTSVLPDATSVARHRCVDGAVELVSTESVAGPLTVVETYHPPYRVWTGEEPAPGITWSSSSTVMVDTGFGAQTQVKSGTWTIQEAGVTATTPDGTSWPDSVRFTVSATTTQNGSVLVSNDDESITSLQGPGIVWTLATTTTPGGTAQSTTRVLSVADPR